MAATPTIANNAFWIALNSALICASLLDVFLIVEGFCELDWVTINCLSSLFKKDLADLAAEKLQPISKEVTKLMSDQDYLDQIMKTGKDKAIAVAVPVLTKVYDIVGFANT